MGNLFTSSGDILAFMVILGLICGIISGAIAWAKHRSFVAWFLAGFFFSLLGILISAIMPKNAKKCPRCGEFSTYGTEICEYCNYEFMNKSKEVIE